MTDILKPSTVLELNEITEDESTNYLVLFTAPSWCVPCRQFAPHFEAAAERVENVVFVYASLDAEPEFANEYSVQSVPTLRLYDDNGDVKDVSARTTLALIHELEDLTDLP